VADVERLIDDLIKKFELAYGIRLTPLARDCLTHDFEIEIEKLIEAAYADGWYARGDCDDETGAQTP
jgi:hypothetical protein